MIVFNCAEREKNVQRERDKEIHTKKYRNKGHCKQTNKQSGENTKMGEIHTNKYREKRHQKHKGLDHPLNYPAE